MVITDVNQVVYQGNGSNTAFPFTFRIIDATDIKLLLIDADGTETDITSDYFVDTNTNTVYYPGYAPGAEPGLADQPAPVQTGQRLVVYRELPVTQEKDLGDKWPFYVIELALDKLTMLIQQVKGIWDRCLKVSVGQEATAPDFDYTVPIEAGKTFRVKDDGTGFELTEDPAVAHAAAVAAQEAAERAQGAAEDARDDAEAAAAQTELQAVWFDNVAAMRAADIPVGMTAGTKGYYVVNDGGSAVYNIREKTEGDVDDGGSVLLLDNGNVAELIINENINVKQFGVLGDGISDDTERFRAALSCAAGKNLIVPHGDYLINNILIARNINKLTDAGVYLNRKPVYPNATQQFSGFDHMTIYPSTNSFKIPMEVDGIGPCQGVAYDSKRQKIIIAFAGENKTYLTVWDVDLSNQTASYNIDELGHCNSLTYVEETDSIYVVGVTVNGETNYNYIYKVDAENYTITQRTLTNERNTQIDYDPVCRTIVGFQKESDAGNQSIIKLNFYDEQLNYVNSTTFSVPQFYVTNGMTCYNGRLTIMLFYKFNSSNFQRFLDTDYFGNNVQVYNNPMNEEPEDFCRIDADTVLAFISKTYVNSGGTYVNNGLIVYKIVNNIASAESFNQSMPFYVPFITNQSQDLNELLMPGIYRISNANSDGTPAPANIRESLHYPPTESESSFSQGGFLLNVKTFSPSNGYGSLRQLYFNIGSQNVSDFEIWSRYLTNERQSQWMRVDCYGAMPNDKNRKVTIQNVPMNDGITYTPDRNGWLNADFDFRDSAACRLRWRTISMQNKWNGETNQQGINQHDICIPVRKGIPVTIIWTGTGNYTPTFSFTPND